MKILIADDESIIRMGLQGMLTDLGHVVSAARNGREATQMIRQQPFDLAILDIKMPYTDGLEAAKIIAKIRPMPVLLLTAFSEQDLIEKATELPIQGYLIKPIKSADLTAAIAVASKRFAETLLLQDQTQKLEETLATRKLIARAKGRLMAAGMSEEEAYSSMQSAARESRKSMRDVALYLLENNHAEGKPDWFNLLKKSAD